MSGKAFIKDYAAVKLAVDAVPKAMLGVGSQSGSLPGDRPADDLDGFSMNAGPQGMGWAIYVYNLPADIPETEGHEGFRAGWYARLALDSEFDPAWLVGKFWALYNTNPPAFGDTYWRGTVSETDPLYNPPVEDTVLYRAWTEAYVRGHDLRAKLEALQVWVSGITFEGVTGLEELQTAIDDLKRVFAETVKKWREH